MPAYRIVLRDHAVEVIDGVDAYQQEGQLTTFFRTGAGRQAIDSWSTRVASFRTSTVLAIRRVELDVDGLADGTKTVLDGTRTPVERWTAAG
ncbi:MAG TPA: hypothetical protein VHA73_07900 [Acidimicrobiales bacterium]|jgi:hypothetical protein|nr:hypothetical protein [Acidimicrobiales bacterium]